MRRALELDPLSPIVNSDLGWYLLYAGRDDEAIAQFRKTLEFDANSVSARRGLGIAYSADGQHDEAIAELKRALALSENSPVILGHLGAAYARARRPRRRPKRVLKQLTAMAAQQYVPASAHADGLRGARRPSARARCAREGVRRARLRDRADRGRAVVSVARGERIRDAGHQVDLVRTTARD